MNLQEVAWPEFATPTLEKGIPGPRGEPGLLLRAPARETLLWDLEAEIGSVRRWYKREVEGWWVALSYYETLLAIVLRSFPSVLVLDGAEDRLISRDGTDVRQERLL